MWRLPRGVIDLFARLVQLGGRAWRQPGYLRTDRAVATGALAVPRRMTVPVS